MGMLSYRASERQLPFETVLRSPLVIPSTDFGSASSISPSSCSPETLPLKELPPQLTEATKSPPTTISPIWGEPPYRYSSSLMSQQLLKDQELAWRKAHILLGDARIDELTKFYRLYFRPFSAGELSSSLNEVLSKLGLPSRTLSTNVLTYVVDVEAVSDSVEVQYDENTFARLGNFAASQIRQLQQYGPGIDTKSLIPSTMQYILNSLTQSSNFVLNVLGGGRLDLPKVWSASTFAPTYTFTVHLCADSESIDSITDRVIVPLYYLLFMSLGELRSGSKVVTLDPPRVRLKVPGVCYIPVGYIEKLTIVRSDQYYTEEGKMLGVDVQFEVSSLFDTLLDTTELPDPSSPTGALTVGDYLVTLLQNNRSSFDITKGLVYQTPLESASQPSPVVQPQSARLSTPQLSTILESSSWNPVPGGKVSSEYGLRTHPIDNEVKFHRGVDIAAPAGTPIRATAGGTVKFVGVKPGYGNVVIIDHGDGKYETVYAHNSQNIVNVGDRVQPGQVIGYVGSTGKATGPHLHYEVRKNGEPVDPIIATKELRSLHGLST